MFINKSALIPRLIIISPTVATVCEIILLLIQLNHLSKSSSSNYHSIKGYMRHLYTMDNIRSEIISNLLSLFTTLLTFLNLSYLWKLASQSIWRFLIIYDAILLIFFQAPSEYIKKYFVLSENTSFLNVLFEQSYLLVNELIGQAISLLIINFIATKTQLQPVDPQEEQNLNDNHEQNEPLPQNRRPSCCVGKFWLVYMIIALVLVLLANIFAVDYIMMDKSNFENLNSDNTIGQHIKNLTSKTNFPFEDVYVQKNGDPNAFFIGITKKRIIIALSLIGIISSPANLCAVVAHELGHWSNHDLIKGLSFSLFVVLLTVAAVYFVSKVGMSGIGLGRDMPVIVLFLCVSAIFELPQSILMSTMNILSLSFENGADCFAAKMGYPIGEALQLLSGTIMTEIESANIYSLLRENHPPLSKRLLNIQKCSIK